ncbi:MAG: maleylpyruvate isomerase family mycothiol-dependent enzyme [Acidimicrobiales bacterium]
MEEIVEALAAQQQEMSGLLVGLDDRGWRRSTRCPGWDVADVVLHVAQSNEMAIGSASGRYAEAVSLLSDGLGPVGSVDEGAAAMVERQRGVGVDVLRRRWSDGAATLVTVLDGMDLSTRVTWVAGELSARTLTTTRLAETWIHAGDVADALGATLPATDRLRSIARLAWRTLPYAFAGAGRTMAGPVAFRLTGPAGQEWDYVPDDDPVTGIAGPAADLCAVAARRLPASATALRGEGPDAAHVLSLVRTYA